MTFLHRGQHFRNLFHRYLDCIIWLTRQWYQPIVIPVTQHKHDGHFTKCQFHYIEICYLVHVFIAVAVAAISVVVVIVSCFFLGKSRSVSESISKERDRYLARSSNNNTRGIIGDYEGSVITN